MLIFRPQMNLSWKLALVSKGLALPSLLDTYDTERQPVIREMLAFTQAVFKSRVTDGWKPHSLSIRQLGVHCRWSPVVLDELQTGELEFVTTLEPTSVYADGAPDRLHAGDRAPEAPGLANVKSGEHTTLFNIFRPTHHTVVVFDQALAELVKAQCPKDAVRTIAVASASDSPVDGEVYVDTEGHAARVYCVSEGVKIVIVRPDGIVGGLLKSIEGVEMYFSKVFSAVRA
jgi:hypothetical protein